MVVDRATGLAFFVVLALMAGTTKVSAACAYDSAGASHAHDGPLPPEPPRTRIALLDSPYNRHFAPCFPPMAARLHHYGTVWLAFYIGENGRIEKLKLDTSSGFWELDDSALDAAKHWRAWIPAAKNGVPYGSWVRFQVAFNPPN